MPVTDYQIFSFYESLSDYGYIDVKTAIEKFQEVDITATDLAYEVREYCESTETPLDEVDVCYVAYDHILQMARNKINEILNFDICNDIKDGTAFYTYGNYMCTSFDYSEEATEQLEEKLEDADKSQIGQLFDDIFVKVFLEDVGIDTKEIQKVETVK